MNPSKKTGLMKVAKDAMRDYKCSSRPTTPPPWNVVVVETDASAVSAKSSASSSQPQVPVKVCANSWGNKKYKGNKARINERDQPNTFWRPSSSSLPLPLQLPSPWLYPTLASQNYYYYPYSPMCYYYVPKLDYDITLDTSIYTPTLDFPYTILPLAKLTELRHQITDQIEYYFSDDNLAKDLYLRSNMDSEGWVSIFLVARFKRISKLTNDALFARDSLIYSTTVEVQGERIRRRDNWEKWLLKVPRP